MDAVEILMVRDGYASLSARSVGRCASLNYQLIFYYFNSIDNLYLATYRRRTNLVLERLTTALASERPLHAYWEEFSDPSNAALSFEYLAMSNHYPAIRAESVNLAKRVFELVTEKVTRRLTVEMPDRSVFTPTAISMAFGFLSSGVGLQSAFDEPQDLDEVRALIAWLLDKLEPPVR